MIFHESFLKILSCRDIDLFFDLVAELIKELEFKDYVIIKFKGHIGEPVFGVDLTKDFVADAVDLGFFGGYESKKNVSFEYFGQQISFKKVFFLKTANLLIGAVCFVEELDNDSQNILRKLIKPLSDKAFEILVQDKRTEVYVDYQKKIDFVKNASSIFKNIKIEDVLSTGISVIMELFSSEASILFYKETFHSIGLEKENLKQITLNGKDIDEFKDSVTNSSFFTEGFHSEKYNINNIFVIYEEKFELKILLFNIHVDFVPDKEFAEMVTNIVSIAMENALSHEKAVEMKLEETEIQKTGEILNMFSSKEIKIDKPIKFYGVSLPAKNAGGDFMGVIETDGKIFICIADVCGKGYSAAVLTVVISTFTEFLIGIENIQIDLPQICNRLSDFILSKNLEGRFITAFFGLYNPQTMSLEYISMGHEPIYLIQKKGIISMDSNYLPLGIINEDYSSKTVNVEKGDRCFFYTDGVVEYIGYEDIKLKLASMGDTPLEHFIKSLYNSCVKDTKKQLDDFTCGLMVF